MNNHRPLQGSRCMNDFRMEVNKRRGICRYSFIRPCSEMKLSYCSALLSLRKYETAKYPHKIMFQIFLRAYCSRHKCIQICLIKTYINKIKRANCEVCKRLANHHFKLHVSSIHRIRVWPVLNTFNLQPDMFQIAKQKTKWVLHNYILKSIEKHVTFAKRNRNKLHFRKRKLSKCSDILLCHPQKDW